ncbi:MAG: lmo0937 family membrane protein [Capsulimonas sp.]|uniref:lmo0937 family membrane protein n=1 Tax=Capsulimonas sp. TaxID=2494211 RepID=UPI0032677086
MGLIYTIASILVAIWLISFLLHVGGSLIHLILVIAVVMFVYNLITGRRAV